MVANESSFYNLLSEMAVLFELEGTDEALQTSVALTGAIGNGAPELAKPYALDDMIQDGLRLAIHPGAVAVRQAHPVLHWAATAILDEYASSSVSRHFTVVSLMGPGQFIEHDFLRAGLYMQTPNSYYQLHHHEAAETYIILHGRAEWTAGDVIGNYGPNKIIHHTPYMPHAFQTFKAPLLAFWRWSGNIDVDTYKLLDDPKV
jgi:mannose-6-phosphate isomerase-like protein (cupin superfamily)|tara:strand:+ start:150 stop:758 length:609 start_codon:yes stop_codon:yes gene_type:complete